MFSIHPLTFLALVAVTNASPAFHTSSGVVARQGLGELVRIHPLLDMSKCLDVRGDALENGTPVQIFQCNETPAQNWLMHVGQTKVQLNGTNFCLDAGSAPANGVGMKIWQCFDNLPAQEWFWTTDDRIALFNEGLCLDLTNGDLENGTQVQTWQCTDDNVNQGWFNF